MVFNCEKHVRFIIDINGEHRILNTPGSVERLENAAGHFVALVRTSNDTFKLFNVNTGENLDLRFQGHVRLVLNAQVQSTKVGCVFLMKQSNSGRRTLLYERYR